MRRSFSCVKFSNEKALGMYMNKRPCRVEFCGDAVQLCSFWRKKPLLRWEQGQIDAIQEVVTLGELYFEFKPRIGQNGFVLWVHKKEWDFFRQCCRELVGERFYRLFG